MLVKGINGGEDSLLPLQKVAIDAKVDGAFATINLDLTYLNPSQESALEATYEFPLDEKTLLAKLTAELNGMTVEAIVRDKEKAIENYEDAIAGGKTAILAQKNDQKQNAMTIKLGNLQPG